MWIRNAKKHLKCSQTALRREDVKHILAALEVGADAVRDETGAFPISQYWEGQLAAIPIFPRSRDIALVQAPAFRVDIEPSPLNQDLSLNSVVKLFKLVPRAETSLLKLVGKVSKRTESIQVQIIGDGSQIQVAIGQDPFSTGSNTQIEQVIAELLNLGNWPVMLQQTGTQTVAMNTEEGNANFSEEQVTFTCPSHSLGKVFRMFSEMLTKSRFHVRGAQWFLHLGVGQITTLKELNRLIRGVKQTGVSIKQVALSDIQWRLKSYKAFAGISELHAILNPKEQIMTRLVEFKLLGYSGFMELGHDHKGYYAWFSFDTEKPFATLQKIIGYSLKEWR